MTVSRRLRFEILRRDNHRCRYCGAAAPDAKITVDHVVPVALGGTDDAANLVAACSACNAGKAASNPDAPLVKDVAQAALKWQLAIKLATDLALRDRERLDPDVDRVIDHWMKVFETYSANIRPFPEPDGKARVREWLARGVSVAELCEYVDVTEAKWLRDRYLDSDHAWRYFAGCCWNRVDQIEKDARELIDKGEVPDGP